MLLSLLYIFIITVQYMLQPRHPSNTHNALYWVGEKGAQFYTLDVMMVILLKIVRFLMTNKLRHTHHNRRWVSVFYFVIITNCRGLYRRTEVNVTSRQTKLCIEQASIENHGTLCVALHVYRVIQSKWYQMFVDISG